MHKRKRGKPANSFGLSLEPFLQHEDVLAVDPVIGTFGHDVLDND